MDEDSTEPNDSQLPANAAEIAEAQDSYPVKGIPNLDFYRKTYAKSCGENDDKAARVFREFENQDRVRKVKGELIAISQSKVSPILCEKILGRSRPVKLGSWEKWALMMIAVIGSKR